MKKLFLLIILFLLPVQTSAAGKVPILVYHSIAEYTGAGDRELYVSPANFEKQMDYLRNQGYTLLTFERFNEINNIKKPIFLTFDDGYKNNLNILPIFQKLNGPSFKPCATLFVISDFIGRSSRLSKEDLKDLAATGYFSIQSHTATHPDLTKAPNLEYELKHSQHQIENVTGMKVFVISYPYGNANKQVAEQTKKYYQYGLTTTPGPYIHTGMKDELYFLPRTYIKYSTTIDEFAEIVKTK